MHHQQSWVVAPPLHLGRIFSPPLSWWVEVVEVVEFGDGLRPLLSSYPLRLPLALFPRRPLANQPRKHHQPPSSVSSPSPRRLKTPKRCDKADVAAVRNAADLQISRFPDENFVGSKTLVANAPARLPPISQDEGIKPPPPPAVNSAAPPLPPTSPVRGSNSIDDGINLSMNRLPATPPSVLAVGFFLPDDSPANVIGPIPLTTNEGGGAFARSATVATTSPHWKHPPGGPHQRDRAQPLCDCS